MTRLSRPLAIFAVLFAAGVVCDAQIVYRGCGVEGSATNPLVKRLNSLKNRFSPPKDKNVKHEITLNALLASGKDTNRWSPDSAAEIEGFVFDVKPGGVESANCGARDLADIDTHIEIVTSLDDSGPTKRLIVEVTPRLRALAKETGQDWSTQALIGLKGHKVKITGWMLFDFEHVDEAENTAAGRRENWRGTAWEIHPVTKITVID
jgi:hypothetical protein